jgi:hypothetical protein
MRNFSAVLVIVILAVILIGGFFAWSKYGPGKEEVASGDQQNQSSELESERCGWEARICPDGSRVTRVGPDCEFEKCPDGSIAQEKAKKEAESVEVTLEKCDLENKEVQLRKTSQYGIFGDDEFDTVVCGYLTTQREQSHGYSKESAYLRIVEFSQEEFKNSLEEGVSEGNAVNKITEEEFNFSLGCLEEGKIEGDIGYQEGDYLDQATQEALLSSSASDPIALKLSFGYHGGKGCFCCNTAHQVRVIN